jgi:hypothetical protein
LINTKLLQTCALNLSPFGESGFAFLEIAECEIRFLGLGLDFTQCAAVVCLFASHGNKKRRWERKEVSNALKLILICFG